MIKLSSKCKSALTVMLCCSSLLLLSACTTMTRTEDVIEKRVTERWNAVLQADYASAYEYLSPGYRSSVSLEQYQRFLLLLRVKWTAARYIESECTETTCQAKVSVDYSLYGAVPGVKSFEGTQTIQESWVLVDGLWYLVPEK